MAEFFILIDEPRRQNAINYIMALNLRGMFSVEIKKYRKNRSHAQNRLYWSWLNILAESTGHEPDDLHAILKARFLGTRHVHAFGESTVLARSTTDLTTQEFTAYLDKIEQAANLIGVRLPHPDDYHYATMREETA